MVVVTCIPDSLSPTIGACVRGAAQARLNGKYMSEAHASGANLQGALLLAPAAYTYSSGLRAPAVIAFVKDILIYLVIIVAIIYLPGQVGGWEAIFGAAQDKMDANNVAAVEAGLPHRRRSSPAPAPSGRTPPWPSGRHGAVHVPALGHRVAVVQLAQHGPPQRRASCRRTPSCSACWPCSAGSPSRPGTTPIGLDGEPNAQLVIPQLFEDMFPAWFAGVAFAAIAIGALVPAAIMSIAAANTFTRNIYKEWLKKDATPAQEAKVSKLMSLLVKAFALVFVLTLDKQNAINFQLLGGIWIMQTFPAVVFSLFTRWFHRYALLAGLGGRHGLRHRRGLPGRQPGDRQPLRWLAGLIPGIEQMGYIAVTAFVINVVLAVVLSAILNAMKVSNGKDETIPFDYFADADDPRVQKDLDEHDVARRAVRRPGRHPGERAGPLGRCPSGGA